MINWDEYKLGEIANFKYGTMPKKDKLGKGIYPTFSGYKYQYSYPEYNSNKGDIIVVARGVGGTGNIKIIKEKCYLTNLSILIDLNNSIIDNQYFYYHYLPSSLRYLDSGSAQSQITINDLKQIKISIPDLPTQTEIAEILSSLDDKIELNNKINKELENLAQTIFKQWFIDFEFTNENGEPYKSSGGEMIESELGEIPAGWVVYSMSDLLETVSKTYPLKLVDEVIFLNTGDIQDGKFLHQNISNPKKLPGQAKKSISKNDILYSEIRPTNKRFAFVHFDSSKYVVSTKLMVLRNKVEINNLFQYFILTQQDQIGYLQRLAESRSGTFPQITFSEVSTIKIALPSFDKVNRFVENVLEPFFTSKFTSEFENQELINLRDTLIPKLISGELEVVEVMAETT